MIQRAFPVTGKAGVLDQGMSLRDYFAAKAIESTAICLVKQPMELAKSAYAIADAMPKEREQ